MCNILVYFLVLGFISIIKCDPNLQIVKNIEDVLLPVSGSVEEKAGSTFSLICELVSTNNETYFDENLSWIKAEKFMQSKFLNDMANKKTVFSQVGINKSEKKFSPLKLDDRGNYFCVSLKFHLHQIVQLNVTNDVKRSEQRPMRETTFCNDHMFQCMSNGVCIIQHYVCDGKPDCKDGSDESMEHCNGDPCKDKIACDDGRCIPLAWCCDRHHDLNCTVTNRPRCCQVLSDSYEELEYGFPNVNQAQNHGARYLFILVCILSILFSIVLLLLILSKVVIFAKKAGMTGGTHNVSCDDVALRSHNVALSIHCRNRVPREIIIDSTDVNDPLIFPPRFNCENMSDQPPSYIDVLRTSIGSEPPPPYTSREILNDNDRNP